VDSYVLLGHVHPEEASTLVHHYAIFEKLKTQSVQKKAQEQDGPGKIQNAIVTVALDYAISFTTPRSC